MGPTTPVAEVLSVGAVVGHLLTGSAESSTAAKLRVQALDGQRVESGDRHCAESGTQCSTDVARVLMSGLGLDVEVGQPPVAGVAEGDAASCGSPGVLLGEELRKQLLRLALGGRRSGQVDALAGHRIEADVHADLVDAAPLADAAASSLALVKGHGVDGSSWTGMWTAT
jgi:hypothetical protein